MVPSRRRRLGERAAEGAEDDEEVSGSCWHILFTKLKRVAG
jgi:hypothetical protein